MGALTETITQLLARRAACVREVEAIDQELATAKTTVADAMATLTPVVRPPTSSPEKRATPPGTSTATTSRRATSTTAAVGPGLIPLEREIRTALVKAPIGAREIARAIKKPFEDVQDSLKKLLSAGRIVKLGNRGPSVRWQLAGAVSAAPARRASDDEPFETVFPKPGHPKASPREAIESARA